MRARDKIAIDHPEKIDPDAPGGIYGCPCHFYNNVKDLCEVLGPLETEQVEPCMVCWDQELPEQPGQKEADKPVVFIAGPITGVNAYWRAFEQAEELLILRHYIPLSPATLPVGMQPWQYERICLAMIDSADAVLFLPGWEKSRGATMEHHYCAHIDKPIAYKVDDLEALHA